MSEEYRYDAFISYRHSELDKFVAENLHKQMEAFHVSKLVAARNGYTKHKINRVFRDKEELPITENLDDPIMAAIRDSEFLIVICTPRLKESQWCRKEIQSFIEIHGREKVLAVLAEGEPADSYPEELLHREKTITHEDGTTEVIMEDIEPLGADVRGKNHREIRKAIKEELPRLIAPIFGTSYDGLRQRHREQRLRKILSISIVVSAVFLTFGIISMVMALQIAGQRQQLQLQNEKITEQNAKITEQNESLLYDQAISLAEESSRLLESGDRVGAIQTAAKALSGDLPYTEEAEYALSESLHVYEAGDTLQPSYQVKAAGNVTEIAISPEGTYFASLDGVNQMQIRKLEDGSLISTMDDIGSFEDRNVVFLSDTKLAYIQGEDRGVYLHDITENTDTPLITDTRYSFLATDAERKYLLAGHSGMLRFYRIQDMTLVQQIAVDKPYEAMSKGAFYTGDSGEYYLVKLGDLTDLSTSTYQLGIIDLQTGKMKTIDFEEFSIQDLTARNGILYVLANAYDPQHTENACRVVAYRTEDWTRLWQQEFSDEYGSFVLVNGGDDDVVLANIGAELRLFEGKTGTVRKSFSISSNPICQYGAANANLFVVFTQQGNRINVSTDAGDAYENASSYKPHSDQLSKGYLGGGGILFTEIGSNTVTRYIYDDPEHEVYEGEIEVVNTEALCSYGEAREFAGEHGYADPKLVNRIFENPAGTKRFVCYRNDKLAIYDAESDELLTTISKTGYDIDTYFGEDADGNYYVGNASGAYKLDCGDRVVAYVEYLRRVNAEEGTFIIRKGNDCTICPNYSLDQLMEMAKEYE